MKEKSSLITPYELILLLVIHSVIFLIGGYAWGKHIFLVGLLVISLVHLFGKIVSGFLVGRINRRAEKVLRRERLGKDLTITDFSFLVFVYLVLIINQILLMLILGPEASAITYISYYSGFLPAFLRAYKF